MEKTTKSNEISSICGRLAPVGPRLDLGAVIAALCFADAEELVKEKKNFDEEPASYSETGFRQFD